MIQKLIFKPLMFLSFVFVSNAAHSLEECALSELSSSTFKMMSELGKVAELSVSESSNQDIEAIRADLLSFYKRELNLKSLSSDHVLATTETELRSLIELLRQTPVPVEWSDYSGLKGKNRIVSDLEAILNHSSFMKPCEAIKALELDTVYPFLEGLEFKSLKKVESVSFRIAPFILETMSLGGDYNITVVFADGTSADWRIDNNLSTFKNLFTGVLQ